jgi:hypothetical protein
MSERSARPPGYLADVPSEDEIGPVELEKQAIQRLSHSYDGLLLHRFLRRTLELCVDLEPSSALPFQNGRRSLARDLMRLMAEGIDAQHGERTDASILTAAGGPARTSARAGAGRGIARRVAVDPSVADNLKRDTAIAAGEPPDPSPGNSANGGSSA